MTSKYFRGCLSVILPIITLSSAQATNTHPQLNGQNFIITVIHQDGFLNVNDEEDGTLSFSGYLIDMLEALAMKDRANFTYELRTPSGYGSSCTPQLDNMFNRADAEDAYSEMYRSQYNCGTGDVNDLPATNYTTDMYFGMCYITPTRQLQNQFTIAFTPPRDGAPGMYGIATGIRTIDDLVEQQKEGKQPPVCLNGLGATSGFIQKSFPGIKVKELLSGADDVIHQAFLDGECQAFIEDSPLAAQFVKERWQQGECFVNGDVSYTSTCEDR
jgi:hypothetical protein